MAKQILLEEKIVYLPPLELRESGTDLSGKRHIVSELVCAKVSQKLDRVELERTVSDFRPDVIGFIGDLPVFIEIAVTHFIGMEKIKKIRAGSYRSIEIDLSKVAYSTTKSQLKDLVVHEELNKKWLSHESASGIRPGLKIQLESRIREADRAYLESRNRGKKTSLRRPKFRSNLLQAPAPASRPLPSPTEFELRWFRCDVCHCTWKISKSEAPYSLLQIDCPNCGHQVSTVRI